MLDRSFTREPLALALRRGDDDFRLLVDRTLSRLFRSQEIGAAVHQLFRRARRAARWSSSSRRRCRTDPTHTTTGDQACKHWVFTAKSASCARVMVCRPGLAHQRLTPGNAAELLFDDVLWVHEAQKDHYDFVLKMRERGIEVLDLHEMLAETLQDKAARAWVLDRRITANDVGIGAGRRGAALARRDAGREAGRAPDRRHRDPRPAQERDVGDADRRLRRHRLRHPAGANTLFQRDPSCWIYKRRHLQPDVLAGAPARDAAAARGLQVPPALQGRRLHDLVGRLRRALRRARRSKAAT